MNCADAASLLNPYSDGELELSRALEIESHIAACARCRAAFAGLEAVRAAIGRHCGFESAPPALLSRVRASLARRSEPRAGAFLRSPLAVAAPGLLALVLSAWLAISGLQRDAVPPGAAQTRVVYHISESQTASAALRNLANHLNAAPDAKVIVVAHNNGVDFLLRGARDESRVPYEKAVGEFARRGVDFRVCYNTLERRQIAANEVIPGATLVPSGIAEIGRLQSREGYAYMRL